MLFHDAGRRICKETCWYIYTAFSWKFSLYGFYLSEGNKSIHITFNFRYEVETNPDILLL